ncbi:MAG: hypothetical protein JWR28_3522, partial [Modestobacter sp.]|nr:hypothetical protein [Modestobacter sp.]
MRLTWCPAVFSLITSVRAIPAFDIPSATSPSTSSSRRQLSDGSRAAAMGFTQLAQHSGGGVHRPRRSQLAEGGQRGARLVAGRVRLRGCDRPREREASGPGFQGHDQASEGSERTPGGLGCVLVPLLAESDGAL